MKAPAFLSSEQTDQLSPDTGSQKQTWLIAVNQVLDDVEEWVGQEREWNISRDETEIDEEALGGTYKAPVLQIGTPQGHIILEPIARAVLGAQGRIDLYAWPSLFRVMLLLQEDQSWVVQTDSGIDWPHPWRKETFFELVKGLLREK